MHKRSLLLTLSLSLVVIGCVPTIAPTPTTAPPSPVASAIPATPIASVLPSATPQPLRPTSTSTTGTPFALYDAHLHYSADSQATYSLEDVIKFMDEAQITRALFSSTPNEGTRQLYARYPQRIVPSLRPYRTRADISTWFDEPAIIGFVEDELKKGTYRALGEFHVSGAQAKTATVKQLVNLAVERNLFLHAHSDAAAIETLFAHNPQAKIIFAHAGMSESVETLATLAGRYPNLWIELSYRPDIAPSGKLDPAWRTLFIRYPNQFLYGTDTWVQERWQQVSPLATWARGWLSELPPEVAQKIATQNFEQLFLK